MAPIVFRMLLFLSAVLFAVVLANPKVPTQDCYQLNDLKVCPKCNSTEPATDGITLVCTKWDNTFTPITEEERSKPSAGGAIFSPRGGVRNPYARPDGPVFGKTCRKTKGKEECPLCVDIRTPFGEDPFCDKFDWYQPDDKKAKKWDADVKAFDEKIANMTCTKQEKQCGSSREGGDDIYFYNPLRGPTGSPCCDGLACKPDPELSIGGKKDAFFCTNCTQNNQQCAGAPNKDYIDYAPCCSKTYSCEVAPDLGFGKWCIPQVKNITVPLVPQKNETKRNKTA